MMSDNEEGQVVDDSGSQRSDGEVTPNSRHTPSATPLSQRSDELPRRHSSPESLRRFRSRSPIHSHSSSEKRHRSYSRSRSLTPVKYSRSRSISPAYRRRHRQDRLSRDYPRSRSRSRSPAIFRSNRVGRGGGRQGGGGARARGHQNSNRDNPEPSRCLGVFGLGLYTQERDLRDVFGRYGPIDDIQVVYDRQTRRSRGFGFIYFKNTDDAVEAKDRCNGLEVDGRRIRVDYSITERAHTPTPGIYLGKPTSDRYRGYRNHSSPNRPHRRSPSPGYRRQRSSRSRSHSWSPTRRY